jgi:glutamate racemase
MVDCRYEEYKLSVSKWREDCPAGGALQLHVQPLRQALLVELVVAGCLHYHHLLQQLLPQLLHQTLLVDPQSRLAAGATRMPPEFH